MNATNIALQVRDLSRRFGPVTALESVDLQLPAGEIWGLLGANGSGKSTLIRCVAGLLPVDSGSIEIAGIDANAQAQEARRHLGHAVDTRLLPAELHGLDCLQLVAQARGLRLPQATLEQAEALRFTPWLDRPVGAYSFGTRQKLSILLAVMGAPPLLLFDESLNGLDPVAGFAFKDLIRGLCRDQGCAALVATHALESSAHWLDAALLLDRRPLMCWNRNALTALRQRSPDALERAVVAALHPHSAPAD
jgi:ABC-2 type transport system ATP-binding protein